MPTRKRYIWMDGRGSVMLGRKAKDYLGISGKESQEKLEKVVAGSGGLFLVFQDERHTRVRNSSYKRLMRDAGYLVYDWKTCHELAQSKRKKIAPILAGQFTILPDPLFNTTGRAVINLNLEGHLIRIWEGFTGEIQSTLTEAVYHFVSGTLLRQDIRASEIEFATAPPPPPTPRPRSNRIRPTALTPDISWAQATIGYFSEL